MDNVSVLVDDPHFSVGVLIGAFPESGRASIAGESLASLGDDQHDGAVPVKLPTTGRLLPLRLDVSGQPLELLCACEPAGALGNSSLQRLLTAGTLFPPLGNGQPPLQLPMDDCGLLGAEDLLEGREGRSPQNNSCMLGSSQDRAQTEETSSPPLLPHSKAVFDSPLGKLGRPSNASDEQQQLAAQQVLPSARPLLAGRTSAAVRPAAAGLSGHKRARPPPGGGTAGARRILPGGAGSSSGAPAVAAAVAAAAALPPGPPLPVPLDRRALTPDFLEAGGYFDMPLQHAAAELRVGVTTLKSVMRQHNIERWPFRKRSSLDRLIQRTRELFAGDPQQCSNVLAKLEQERLNLRGGAVGGKITGEVKRYRQSIFKLDYKMRRLGDGEDGGPNGEALSHVCHKGRKSSIRILAGQGTPQQQQQQQEQQALVAAELPGSGRAAH